MMIAIVLIYMSHGCNFCATGDNDYYRMVMCEICFSENVSAGQFCSFRLLFFFTPNFDFFRPFVIIVSFLCFQGDPEFELGHRKFEPSSSFSKALEFLQGQIGYVNFRPYSLFFFHFHILFLYFFYINISFWFPGNCKKIKVFFLFP